MNVVRRNVRVKGRVQGVGFRYFTQDAASRLGLAGMVRNLPDGDVELEAEGPDEKMASLVQAVSKGPAMSFVSEVLVTECPVKGEKAGFRVSH